VFAIVDIETCGAKFAFRKGRIIDICILVHDGISVIDKFSTLINPECHISGFYTNISGITNEMVKDAPRFQEVAREILSYTEGKIFVAHNSSFDYHFIRDEFASMGYSFRRDTLCTVRLSRKLLPGRRSYSLGNLCAELGIEIQNRHRAEGDAIATGKLLDLLLQLKTQSKEFKSSSLLQIMSTRTQAIKKYILDKLPETTGVYYFLNQKKEILYIGKSLNMYQRALSHYNTDLKKTKQLLHELYDVDYVETGGELISLLLESAEIKKHKPTYNRQRKKDVFTHSIITCTDEDGIQLLEIIPYRDDREALLNFTNYASARERLEQWMDEQILCQKYCGLTDSQGPCFHYQIKKCNGICVQEESPKEYNERVEKLLKPHRYDQPHFIILEKGRKADELGFVWIQNYAYRGYGYIPTQDSITDTEELIQYVKGAALHADENDIIRSWLKQQKRARILPLKSSPL